jgi:dCMP deaminase
MKTLIAYIPALHQGYMNMIREIMPSRILVISDGVMDSFDMRRKDIRALPAKEVATMLRTIFPDILVGEGGEEALSTLSGVTELWMPDEDISDKIIERFLPGRFVNRCSWFLRYDHKRSLAPIPVVANRIVSSSDPFVVLILERFKIEAAKSSDWWRQVPSVMAKDGEILAVAHNHHVPDDNVPYILGDPRSNFNKGVNAHISTGAHSEGSLLVRLGYDVCLGADLYVGTFPCPFCANLISESGIARLFFVEGYAMLDGVELLKQANIEIIQIV